MTNTSGATRCSTSAVISVVTSCGVLGNGVRHDVASTMRATLHSGPPVTPGSDLGLTLPSGIILGCDTSHTSTSMSVRSGILDR